VIANGAQTATIDVTGINDDALVEGNETVIVTLNNTDNALFTIGGSNSDTVTITDNDTPLDATLSVSVDGDESGPTAMTFRVDLSGTNNTGSTLTYDLADLGTGSATSVDDYAAFAGAQITIVDGTDFGSVSINVVDDSLVEALETVDVQITSADAFTTAQSNILAGGTATADIDDNDNSPVATANSYTLDEGALQSSNIITDNTGSGVDSDSDLPAQTLTIESVNDTTWASLTDSTHGTYTSALGYKEVATTNGVIYILQDGTTQYQHDDTETTSDSFTYTVTDSTNGSNTSTVSYVVTPVNDNDPIAVDESITVNEGATITTLDGGATSVLDNDTDVDLPNDTLSVVVDTDVVYGSLTLNADGTFSYSHDGTENFYDSFTYIVSDANGGVTDTGTVTITINPVNDTPVVDSASLTLNEGDTVTLSAANFGITDPDDTAFTYTVSGVTGGYFQLSSNSGVSITSFTSANLTGSLVQFIDDGNEVAPAFSVTVNDGDVDSNTLAATINYSDSNDKPVLTGDLSAAMNEGATYIITDTDLGYTEPDDGDAAVTFTTSSATNGKIQVNGIDASSFTGTELTAGLVTFVHDGSETTVASFDVNVEDGNEDVSLPTNSPFSFTVTQVNDAPVTTNNSYTLNEGALESGNNIITNDTGSGTDSDSDLPADTLTIESVNGTAW
ncbi:MAG: hypothetical protein GY939_28735, partial [Actinomycetia bacterium]|nr:hypothetical protein [Actinomycetes bacterium]